MESTGELQIKVRQLEKELSRLNESLKLNQFGINWIDVPEAFDTESENKIPILEEVKEKAVENNGDKPTHIFIEGDNYHALHCLNYTHKEKIDVIYIDPPYNTGKDGFTYKDARFLESFPDGSELPPNHPLRHSCWLSYMWKRLSLAKELLSDKGVIFLSIGDDELCNLKLLCDKVFLESNFIETYVWNSISRPDNSSPILRRNAEFVLCYAKDKSKIAEFSGVASETSGMPSLTKSKENISDIEFPLGTVRTTLANGTYKAGVKPNGNNPKWELLEDVVVKDGIIVTPLKLRGHSYWTTKKKIYSELAAGTEIWIKTEAFVPYYKKQKESVNRPTKILPAEYVKEGIYANDELKGIFGQKVFSNPKPSPLIGFLVNFVYNKHARVLDFFAGSGTTMQAVMNLNAKDEGDRQCILVQLADPTWEIKKGQRVPKKGYEGPFNAGFSTISDVTFERNKRVANGYVANAPKTVDLYSVELNKDNLKKATEFLEEAEHIVEENKDKFSNVKIDVTDGFLKVCGTTKKEEVISGTGENIKYYKASFIGKNRPKLASDEDKILLAKKAGNLLAIAENTLYEVSADEYIQVFADKHGHSTFIYSQEDYSRFESFKEKVESCPGKKTVYVFCWTDGAEFREEFAYIKDTEVKSIPQPILDIYKSLNI